MPLEFHAFSAACGRHLAAIGLMLLLHSAMPAQAAEIRNRDAIKALEDQIGVTFAQGTEEVSCIGRPDFGLSEATTHSTNCTVEGADYFVFTATWTDPVTRRDAISKVMEFAFQIAANRRISWVEPSITHTSCLARCFEKDLPVNDLTATIRYARLVLHSTTREIGTGSFLMTAAFDLPSNGLKRPFLVVIGKKKGGPVMDFDKAFAIVNRFSRAP